MLSAIVYDISMQPFCQNLEIYVYMPCSTILRVFTVSCIFLGFCFSWTSLYGFECEIIR